MKFKNIRFVIIGIAAAILAVSCNGFEPDVPESPFHEYPVMLSVAGEKNCSTRMTVKNGTDISWEESDKIRLTAVASDGDSGTAELSVYSIDQENNGKAVFSGFVSMKSMPEDCYLTFPVGEAMKVDTESDRLIARFTEQNGEHKPFLYAKTGYDADGMNAVLNHVGAMLEIDIAVDDVATVTFAGNGLEKLSPLEIDPATGGYTLPTETHVQITVPVQKDGKTYICVPPIKFPKGFSLILSKADGSAMIRSYSSDGTHGGGYDFSTKKGHIIPVTVSGDFVDFGVTCSTPVATHTKNGNLLTGTSVSFVLSKTGAPDKMIEEWGATLVNSSGEEVRNVKFTNNDLKNGSSIVMDVANNWKLLPEGTYTFTPYYKMYGEKITLTAYAGALSVDDPEVKIEISGQTSYDKYKASQISAANSHSNSLISGVSVSVNVDNSIIDSFTADFNKEITKTKNQLSGGVVSFGDLTRSAPKAYPLNVVMKVGELEFEANRDFHITGLPYEVNFQTSSQISGWTQNGVIIEQGHYHFPNGTSSVISPKFHIPDNPDNINVDVSLGGWAYQGWTSSSATAYIDVTSSVTAKQSGIKHSFSMDSWSTNPGNQQGETMSGQLIMSQSDNRISICCVTSEGGGIPGISVGLYAKKFTLKYR